MLKQTKKKKMISHSVYHFVLLLFFDTLFYIRYYLSLTAAIMKYMKYVTELEFETKPNYSYLRNLFVRSGSQDGNIPTCLYSMKESNENLTSAIFFERPYLRERRPCKPVNGEVNFT